MVPPAKRNHPLTNAFGERLPFALDQQQAEHLAPSPLIARRYALLALAMSVLVAELCAPLLHAVVSGEKCRGDVGCYDGVFCITMVVQVLLVYLQASAM